MKVLRDYQSIDDARKVLVARGLSTLESPLQASLRKLRLRRELAIGDRVKSWDVLKTLEFLEAHVARDQPILDIGAFCSEIIIALHRAGFSDLAGADLNPTLMRMPHADAIRYQTVDFMNTRFEDGSFQAITSISVIEHNFRSTALLREISRLLRSGGYFTASFDYWPEPLDTKGVKFFGMDWLIFSRRDVSNFVAEAAEFGLAPVGDLDGDATTPLIDCGGQKYTFGWLVLQKR